MYHSVSFWTRTQLTDAGGRNSWASWRLIPSSRPYISPPTQKTNYIDIPCSNGAIDVSELGLSDGVFNNREGNIDFIIVNENLYGYDESKERTNNGNAFTSLFMSDGKNTHWSWDQTYSTIMDYLHGERRKIVLEDDPSFYYIGRVSVDSFSSEQKYSTISIKYNVDPFKKMRFSTTENWLWDAIDFDVNPDILGIKDITLSKINDGTNQWSTVIKTLRKRIVPKIITNDSIYLLIGNDNLGYRVFPMRAGTNKIDEVYSVSNPTMVITFTHNNESKTVTAPTITDINELYFEGMTNDLLIVVINDSTENEVIFSIDYRLEGF